MGENPINALSRVRLTLCAGYHGGHSVGCVLPCLSTQDCSACCSSDHRQCGEYHGLAESGPLPFPKHLDAKNRVCRSSLRNSHPLGACICAHQKERKEAALRVYAYKDPDARSACRRFVVTGQMLWQPDRNCVQRDKVCTWPLLSWCPVYSSYVYLT